MHFLIQSECDGKELFDLMDERIKIKWSAEKRMQLKEAQNVPYLYYEEFEKIPWLLHGFSTRLGGVSEGVCATMNLSFSRGDDPNAVMENYRRISRALGFLCANIVTSDQTHTTNVRVVGKEDCGCGVSLPRKFHDVDGMITNEPEVMLATFYADCVPLYFVDTKKRAIGLSHSGWRGTIGKIGAVTIEKMREEYGSIPENIYAAIGPSICQECYEVSEDVINAFENAFDSKYWDRLFYKKENGKYQLSLWSANRIIFQEAGIKEERILMPGVCTCCNPKVLFSHRASQGKRGNLAAFLGIKEI